VSKTKSNKKHGKKINKIYYNNSQITAGFSYKNIDLIIAKNCI